MDTNRLVLQLLEKSYSPFHAVKNMEEKLAESGFERLDEKTTYSLKEGGSYYVKRNDSSILAFRLPRTEKPLSFRIAAVHSDSPTFKLKPNPLLKKGNLFLLNVEPYGGAIYSTWTDRPLSFAGRVMIKTEQGISSHLIAIDEDLLQIPNLCIHMNRDANNGFAYNPAKDLIPVFGYAEEGFDFNEYLLSKLGVKGEILAHDLFLYNRDKPRLVGREGEFVSAGRLDDLASAYTTLFGFLESKNEEAVDVFVCFDNEEVGSLTKQGANSDFLKNNLERILIALGKKEQEGEILARSFLLSVDNAHANHPNYPEISDPTTCVQMGKGIVIKYNANQKYTSDALSASYIKDIASEAGVPVQEYTNRSDLRGGSTLGNISNSELSLNSCDIGLPQLAMHSSNEFLGIQDLQYMVRLTSAYFGKYC